MGLATLSLICLAVPIVEAQQAPIYSYQSPGYAQAQYQAQPEHLISPQYAQQADTQPPSTGYVSPAQFLPTFGRKLGSMFRKLFYGRAQPAGYTQQTPEYSYPQPGRGNLDQPPSGYSMPSLAPTASAPISSYPPRYEMAPAPKLTPSPALPPTSRLNSGGSKTTPTVKKKMPTSSTSKQKSAKIESDSASTMIGKYTPPTITSDSIRPANANQQPKTSNTRNESAISPSTKSSTDTLSNSSSKSSTNSAANSNSFLRGKKASKKGRVISPYPPYRELDVSGLSSGSLALDPTTQKVFEVP
jgi:hypothetical protein